MMEAQQDADISMQQRCSALSQWDNEGGAGPDGPQEGQGDGQQPAVSPLTDVEIMQLRVRVIALENLVIALLAHSSDQARATSREMADYILPKLNSTPHRLTIRAATHMIDLLERSKHFQTD